MAAFGEKAGRLADRPKHRCSSGSRRKTALIARPYPQYRERLADDAFTARRDAAADRLVDAVLPTSAEEIWRYSRIDLLDLGRYATVAAATCTIELPDDAAAAGVVVRRLVDLSTLSPSALAEALAGVGELIADDADAIATLATATLSEIVLIDVPAGAIVTTPIRLHHHIGDSGAVVSVRIVVRSGSNSDVTIIERATSSDVASLFLPITELHVAQAARLRFVTVQTLGSDMWQLARQASRTAKDASLSTMAVALGGSYARVRTDAAIVGRGGHTELLAVYFGEADQMHDFRTVQQHIAPNSTSDLLFKGAVGDKARSVYSGLIHIGPEARGTVANQTNRNLILSADASAESVPNLEIENNEVKCSHASAVGPIDDDHRYYLESRGVPDVLAERLIVLGFFADLLDRIPDPALRDQLVAAVEKKFDRRVEA